MCTYGSCIILCIIFTGIFYAVIRQISVIHTITDKVCILYYCYVASHLTH